MGQDLHITRAKDWERNQGREITEIDWQSCVQSDPELSPDPSHGPNAALWTGHPHATNNAWLDWFRGNIYTTDADAALIAKMQEVAARLKARLVDDENQQI